MVTERQDAPPGAMLHGPELTAQTERADFLLARGARLSGFRAVLRVKLRQPPDETDVAVTMLAERGDLRRVEKCRRLPHDRIPIRVPWHRPASALETRALLRDELHQPVRLRSSHRAVGEQHGGRKLVHETAR